MEKCAKAIYEETHINPYMLNFSNFHCYKRI
jgi:hypothetical protein